MHRFFVPPECVDGDSVHFPYEASEKLRRVLRARRGDVVTVLDGSGFERTVRLDTVDQGFCAATVLATGQGFAEPLVFITLYQALLKSDRFDYALQKGVEVGVSKFVPYVCERTEVTLPGDSKKKRWRRIIKEASEQSGRAVIPELTETVSFETAVKSVSCPAIIPWEEEKGSLLRRVLAKILENKPTADSKLAIFIGPVGGFTFEEIHLAEEAGIIPVSLGNRILRSETAGIFTVATVLYEAGEMG